MIAVNSPSQNKLQNLAQTNSSYWSLCVSRSQYTEDEINNALAEIDIVNAEVENFKNDVYNNILTDKDGEMNTRAGFASDVHKEIYFTIFELEYVNPNMSENSHSNCLPVAKWQKEIKATRRLITKIQKMIKAL